MMKLPALLLSIVFLLSACTGPPALSSLRLTYVGTFESVRESEDPLNCFCADGGYLTSCGGQRIPVCFMEAGPPEGCLRLEVQGAYQDGVADTPPDGPCPEGVMRYLFVERWRCLD